MKNIFLCSEQFIRSLTNIDNNIQGKFLQSAMRESQDIDLQQVLGTNLFQKLLMLVASDEIGTFENIEYKKLLDNCQYFLAYSSIAKIIPICNVKISNIGVNQTDDENVKSLSLKEMFQMEDYYKKKADFYKGLLQAYLEAHAQFFDEMKDCNCNGIGPEVHSAASTSIFLGGRRSRNINYKNNKNSYLYK